MENYETNPRLAKMKSPRRPYENRETNPIRGFFHESQTISNSGFIRIDPEIGWDRPKVEIDAVATSHLPILAPGEVKPHLGPVIAIAHAPHITSIAASGYHKNAFRADCNDCTCATRNPNCRKGILPRTRFRTDCDDYTCATRKPNHDRQMRCFRAVPIMHAPHVKSFAVRICGIRAISRPSKVCALFKRVYEPTSSALSGNVSSREDTVWEDANWLEENEANDVGPSGEWRVGIGSDLLV
jgi:hypothetical protein